MSASENGIEQLDPDAADAVLAQGGFLLDVREDDEWAAGHAPAATHLPMGQVPEGHARLLPRDQRIVVMCRSGARSNRVAGFLREAGYDAVNAAGGMQAWAASGRAVVDGEGGPGTVA